MPYIKQEQRALIHSDIVELVNKIKHYDKIANNASFTKNLKKGILNYVITATIVELLGKDYSYSDINDVIGALECCKLELYRRLAANYEDLKIKENGDVY